MVRCEFGSDGRVHIQVDQQYLSRITPAEVRDLIIQLLVFGGSKLRSDINHWLSGGKLNELGEYLAPDREHTAGGQGPGMPSNAEEKA